MATDIAGLKKLLEVKGYEARMSGPGLEVALQTKIGPLWLHLDVKTFCGSKILALKLPIVVPKDPGILSCLLEYSDLVFPAHWETQDDVITLSMLLVVGGAIDINCVESAVLRLVLLTNRYGHLWR